MINLKDKKISNIFLGNKKINKVYLGSTQVYSSSRLPKEYQEVEYIESTGTQYIDTEVLPKLNLKIDIDFSITSIQEQHINIGFFGSLGNQQNTNAFCLSSNESRTYMFPQLDNKARNIISNPNMQINKKYSMSMSKDGWYYNNTLGATWTNPDNITSNRFIYIFKINSSYPSLPAYIKLYSFKIYESNILVRDFIPCYRKADGEIGLYDLVNDLFYTNAGTGTFIKGGDV